MDIINEDTLPNGEKIKIIRSKNEERIEYICRTEDGLDLWKIDVKTDMSDLEQEFFKKFIKSRDSIIDF
ncbi:MAG: hypothetical protein J6C25_09905 [Treponema sp.]|nr:hypothetical protein [Treponema sp.]MBP3562207.1 hypothetical protein [Treponema sp.]